MVSLITSEWGNYIKQHTEKSLLLRAFSTFLWGKTNISEEDMEELRHLNKDYRDVAAIGFLVENNNNLLPIFEEGLEWLIGRKIPDSNPLVRNNIALFGIIIGSKAIHRPNLKKSFDIWVTEILSKRENNHLSYHLFFSNILRGKVTQNSNTELEVELAVFAALILKTNSKEILAKYLEKVMLRPFPYYQGDIFRTIINIYSVNKILTNYVLKYTDFENLIQESKADAKEEQNNHLKKVLIHRVNKYSLGVLSAFVLMLIAFFATGVYFVITGDWNFLEPRTFVLFGTPFLVYILTAIGVLLSKSKEGFSLHPKRIYQAIFSWRKKYLFRVYGVSDIN